MEIKYNLLLLGKRQIDLVREIRKRGYPKMTASLFSKYLNGYEPTPQCEAVLKLAEQIIDEWKEQIRG